MGKSAQHRSRLSGPSFGTGCVALLHACIPRAEADRLNAFRFTFLFAITSVGIRGHRLCLELDNTRSSVAFVVMCLARSGPLSVWICASFSFSRPYLFFHNLSTCSLQLLSLFWASGLISQLPLSSVSLPLDFQCLLQIIHWVYVLVSSGYHSPNFEELFILFFSTPHSTDSLFIFSEDVPDFSPLVA